MGVISINKISYDNKDIENISFTPKDKNEKIIKEDWHVCKECSNKCKKEKSLEKHMLTKHQAHQCKECKDEIPTFMELLKHIAKYHCKDQGDVVSNQDEKDGASVKENHEKEREDGDNPKCVFKESMLD